ncbi:hypothetical protein [Anabaena sp. CCY 9402-a]|uniref:hypothetical protein n=1 Tax=Anabaena sp. CCY 9402-a TaxID=3103867 RepID=UPI0039C5F665
MNSVSTIWVLGIVSTLHPYTSLRLIDLTATQYEDEFLLDALFGHQKSSKMHI